MLTEAYLELPLLIASAGIERRYQQARQLLEQHRQRLVLPADYFRWHAAQALISSAEMDASTAREHAHLALAAAVQERSGIRHHPSIGVVGTGYERLRKQLSSLGA